MSEMPRAPGNGAASSAPDHRRVFAGFAERLAGLIAATRPRRRWTV